MKPKLKNLIIILFLTFLLMTFFKIDFRLKEIPQGALSDDSSYYYHAQTIGVDLDLDYSNQLKGTNKRNLNVENNKPVPVHPIGVGLLAGPFLFLSNILNNLFNLDSVVSFNYFVYSLVPIIYIFFGLRITNKVLNENLKNYNPIRNYLFLLGSGLTYYAFERFSMSHSYEYFSIVFIFYLSFLYQKKQLKFLQFLIPFSMFFLLTLRWSNYHIFIIPLIYFELFHDSKKIRLYFKPFFFIGGLIGVIVFLLHTKFLYGLYTFNPSDIFLLVENRLASNYESLLDFDNFGKNFILALKTLLILLFTKEFGLFFFTPIIFIGFLSLTVFIYKKKFKLFFLISIAHLIPFLGILVFQNTSYSYGFRYMFSLIGLNIFIYFKFFSQNKIITYYLVVFSIFGIFSQLIFETSEYSVLSTNYVINSFGQETLYANPDYLNGVFKSSIIFDSYLNIVFTSFLGVFIIKILSLFIDPFEFISQFKSINEDIELLINNSVEISWIYLFIVILTLFVIIRSLFQQISFNNKKLLRS